MTIINGDCLDIMRTYPDNHFSAIVTDPPYGLSFMNKGWDHAVPGRNYWKAFIRCLKPGGFLLAMGGTRTFHRLTSAIEDGGYEIRDCLMWIYGSGFPKSHNHFGIKGYGTALKPAYEPIIMAMKPLDGTFKQNAEKWGQAGINIDGCRIGTDDTRAPASKNVLGIMNDDSWKCRPMIVGSANGRWPANVIFDEEAAKMLDEQSGLEASRFFYCAKASSRERNEGLEHLPLREAEFTCRLGNDPTKGKHNQPKQNSHPTVKPLKLMEYLIRLVMPSKDGILLDPFAGSGTTILAAKRLGFDAIGIEKIQEYCDIANARISA